VPAFATELQRWGATIEKLEEYYSMPLEIGQVQSTIRGRGFNLKDDTGRRWFTLSYRTEAEARVARKAIEEATDHVLHADIHGL
jgi:hypothetical protein